MGGWISVASEENVGTKFFFVILVGSIVELEEDLEMENLEKIKTCYEIEEDDDSGNLSTNLRR